MESGQEERARPRLCLPVKKGTDLPVKKGGTSATIMSRPRHTALQIVSLWPRRGLKRLKGVVSRGVRNLIGGAGSGTK